MDVAVAPVSAEDRDAFVAAVCASHDLHHPWINPADSAERFEEWLERLGRDDQDAYLIRHESCGELVGYVSVSNIVRRAFQSAQLGVGIAPPRGEHPADQQGVTGPGAKTGIRAGGVLASLPHSRFRLARPREVGHPH